MTMAEKQAAIAAERRQKEHAQRTQFEAHAAFWDTLGRASSSGTALAQAPKGPLDGVDDLLQPSRAAAQTTATPPVVVPADPFDFDAFEIETSKSGATTATSRSEMRTPVSHFDFGDGDGYAYDDDDLLGELGKPPAAAAAQNRASPPPHIVGQIVEMGFAPAQARQALAKTSTGLDVQQALDVLLGAGAAGGQGSGAGPSRSRDGADINTEAQAEAEAEAAEKERRRRRRAGPLRDSIKPTARPRPRPRTAEEHEHGNDAQDQAERILAQASEIGQSMFNKATLFWNSSKERAMKVYEEQKKAAMEAAEKEEDKRKNPKSAARSRPKWMQEDEDWKDERLHVKGGFKDSDDDEQEEKEGRLGKTTQSGNLLFDADHPRPSRPSSRPKPVARPAPSSSSSPKPPRPAASPLPLPARTIVPATPQQLESSAAHKTKGNHHFKLGRFTEAESAYSSAIAALPRGNLFLIPLLTNRATARLKLGDSVNAAGDCTTVIDLVGPSYHPSKESPLPPEYAEVKLDEGLSKAMVKRAQAWEMGEKWKAALDDWERVMGLDGVIFGGGGGGAASMRHMAAEGARRARRMMKMQDGGETPSSMSSSVSTRTTTTTTSTPRPVATSPAPSRPSASASAADVNRSAAVADLRKAAQALEAEEEARLKHKDHVDNKITNWKTGKETNLRALIASLDTVLWDDIVKEGGLKVGMHELVTDKQVKIKYMKVIARLHPDKLNTQNTTVEQRMLANGAFGVLSDAWQAFNQ
ncbi:UBA/TS-N domain-containing protein [Cryptococcus gattii E566]|uniref:UBA/TS-N domain-containing protein n=1 Tax=Cryptococcus gattii EJB2 TaxID=1296103 RepID=A0ABR5BVX9_9TREE|nr:UBA/TS-N domain-containing protein [Cryptococcus gattii EJB2]KIY36998.1 UBA/TS-N domain-containing protein [Cryptococcus gattii E566]